MSEPVSGGWIKLSIGSLVYHKDDPRHAGRIELIDWSRRATVRWLETWWISDVDLADLRWARRRDYI